MQKYSRNCPRCNKEILYKSEENRNYSEEYKKLCRSCISSTVMKDKTPYDCWLEKYGKDIADKKYQQWRNSLNKRKNKGKDNPNYGGKYSKFEEAIEWTKNNLKGKTLEETYGEDKAKEIKQKISNKTKGENNPMYGKPAPIGSGNGYSGYYKGYYFRSILELSYLKYLLDNNIKFENGEKKEYNIPYEINGNKKTYHPDFYLIEREEVIEIKPKNLINTYINKIKFEFAKKKYGDKHKVLTEDNIQKLCVSETYQLYIDKYIQFDKGYEEKFLNYYQKNREDN